MQAAYYSVIFVIKNRIFYCVFPLIKIKKRYSNFCGYKSHISTNFLEEKSYSISTSVKGHSCPQVHRTDNEMNM